jgi:sugar-specific transcriptional regulator TrmB
MEKDLVWKLSDFGLTVNQAKVYLSIVQSGATCVSRISESTRLHRQNIYRMLPKLEEMGLIMKRLGTPSIIEAIPVEKALNRLFSTEREEANERISRLEANLKELINALREKETERTGEQEEARFTLLSTDAEIKNIADLLFENTRTEFDLVTSLELLTRGMPYFRENFEKLSERGVKIRIIVENLNNEDLVKRTLEKVRPDRGDFAAKLVYKSRPIPYRIIDNKEIWIRRRKLTKSGLPAVLWTNGRTIVQFYKESFEKAWNDRHAVSIYPERDVEKRTGKSSVRDT